MKACWWCQHFDYNNSDPGYSEMTPGWSWSMSCRKKHWKFDTDMDSQEEFGKCLMTAENCEDYKKI